MRSPFIILGLFLVILAVDVKGQMTDDFATTDEDENVTFNVTDNDDVFLKQPGTVDLNTFLSGRQTTRTTPEGTYTVKSSGDVTFSPAADYFGSSSIQYSMQYGLFGTSLGVAIITVTIKSVNDAPVAKNDNDETDEDQPIDLKVLSNDEDIDDGINPASIRIEDPSGGTFVANSSGEVTFTPTLNFVGVAKAKYTVRDFAGAVSNKVEIKVTVNAKNDPPIAVNDVAVTDEGVAITIKILSNDDDPDGSIVPSTVLISGATGGTFVVNNNGEVKFTPSPGFGGTATANYTVEDDAGLVSNTATITVTVNSVNDPPIAGNDIAAMDEDATPILINVLSNDSDPDGNGTLNPASVVVTNPVNGTFVANSSGIVTFTPTANFNGIATAKYTVKDDKGTSSNEATVTVTVRPVNDPPTFDAIANQKVLENSANKTVTITGISAGPGETEILTFKATSGTPSLVPNPTITYNGTAATATLTFKPQPNQTGVVTITVEATDPGGNKFSRPFQIEVIKVEFISVPVTIAAIGQPYSYFIEITSITETLTIVATQKPAWATLTPTGKNKATLSGSPPQNAPVTSDVILQLKDGATVIDQQQFTITLNRPPTVTSFGLQAQEDTPLTFAKENFESAYSDPEGQPLSEIQFTQLPKHGVLRLGSATLSKGDKIDIGAISNVSYIPSTDYVGLDTLYWKGQDGISYSQNEAYVHYVIAPANDAPVIEFLETSPLQYELGSEVPVRISKGITIKDIDDTHLVSAEIGIRFTNYEAGKELLIFNDTLNVHGHFEPAAGIMVLSGYATVENYQAALRSIKYNYTHLEKVTQRGFNIYVNLFDGLHTSDTKERPIELIYTFKDLDIPTAFTPNGDPANDAWVITSPNTQDGSVPYEKAHVRVYTKSGLLVYESIGFTKPWDGTFQGKELPVDTYFYTIDLKYNRVRYKGVVTILR